jgi:hypothetical protein
MQTKNLTQQESPTRKCPLLWILKEELFSIFQSPARSQTQHKRIASRATTSPAGAWQIEAVLAIMAQPRPTWKIRTNFNNSAAQTISFQMMQLLL